MIKVLIPTNPDFKKFEDELKTLYEKIRIKFVIQILLSLSETILYFICLLMIMCY